MSNFTHAIATAHDALADLREEARQRRASETVAEHIMPLDIHRESVADDRVTHEVSFTVEGIEVPIEVAGATYAEQVAELLRSDAFKQDVRVIPRSGK